MGLETCCFVVYFQCVVYDHDALAWDEESCETSDVMTHEQDGFNYYVCSCSKIGTVR